MPLSARELAIQTAGVLGSLVLAGRLIRRLGGDDPAEDRLIRWLQSACGHHPPTDGDASRASATTPGDSATPQLPSIAPGPTPLTGVTATGAGVVVEPDEVLDVMTGALSWYSGVPQTIANGAAWCGITWLLTRDPRSAIAPGAALALETACFVGSAALIGRPRPERVWRPEKPHATPSFPSGHTAAAFALHATLANLLAHHGRGTRLGRYILRWEIPGEIAFSRAYRGQHHITDVLAGALLGRWSAHVVRRALLEGSAAPASRRG